MMSADVLPDGLPDLDFETNLVDIPAQYHDHVRLLYAINKFVDVCEIAGVPAPEHPGYDLLGSVRNEANEIVDMMRRFGDFQGQEELLKQHKLESDELKSQIGKLEELNKEHKDKIQILEGNRGEIMRLQDLVENMETAWDAEKSKLTNDIDSYKAVVEQLKAENAQYKAKSDELERRMEFMEEEKTALEHSLETVQKQKKIELEKLQMEILEADKMYMSVCKTQRSGKENQSPELVDKSVQLDNTNTTVDINTTKTLSHTSPTQVNSSVMDNTLSQAELPDVDVNKVAVDHMLTILNLIYTDSNKLVQLAKRQHDWELALNNAREVRQNLYQLVQLFIAAKQQNVSFDLTENVIRHLKAMATAIGKVSRK